MKTQFKHILISQVVLLVLVSCNNPEPVKKSDDSDYCEKCRILTLSENKIGQVYMYKIIKDEFDELHVNFLGKITAKNGKVLNIVNSVNYSGAFEDSKRGTGRVFIYDEQYRRIGNYYVGGSSDVPSCIQGSSLIFFNVENGCNDTTAIDLFDSIPKEIFVKCNGTKGDFYGLDTK